MEPDELIGGIFLSVFILILAVLFGGEPDLMDAIVKRAMQDTQHPPQEAADHEQ